MQQTLQDGTKLLCPDGRCGFSAQPRTLSHSADAQKPFSSSHTCSEEPWQADLPSGCCQRLEASSVWPAWPGRPKVSECKAVFWLIAKDCMVVEFLKSSFSKSSSQTMGEVSLFGWPLDLQREDAHGVPSTGWPHTTGLSTHGRCHSFSFYLYH